MKNPEVVPAETIRSELNEEIHKRNLTSKTYSLDNNRHRLCKCVVPVHYKEKGIYSDDTWEEIDLSLEDNGEYYTIKHAPYVLNIFKDKIKYSYISKQTGRIDVELHTVGDEPFDETTSNISPQIVINKENRLTWNDVINDVDLFIVAKPIGISLYKSLKTALAHRRYIWDVYEDIETNANFIQSSAGFDKDKHNMEINYSVEDRGTHTSIETGKEYRHLQFTEEWTGRVSVRDPVTHIKKWTDKVTYPAVIDADVTENIAADADDGHGYHHQIAPDGWVSQDGGGGRQYYRNLNTYAQIGLRFQSIPIPQGATIDTANLKMVVNSFAGPSPPGPPTKIYGDDVDSAAIWTNADLPTNINKTASSTNWTATAIGLTTLDVKNIVQTIINRAGWASNNNMRFGVLNIGPAGYDGQYIDTFFNNQPNAAVLEIDYTSVTVAAVGPYKTTIGKQTGTKIRGTGNWPHIG